MSISITNFLQRSLRALARPWRSPWTCAQCQRRLMTTDGRFEAGDTALLRRTTRTDSGGLLLWPLQAAKKSNLHEGILEHDHVIGKRVREVVSTHKGKRYMIHDPTLEDYVQLTPRSCTPIYAADANLIVSLLDIHIPRSLKDGGQRYAILEAGTGHGSLTLHLARAIHAANPSSDQPPGGHEIEGTGNESQEIEHNQESASHAVIHTVDNNSNRSKHAQKIVRGFRGGLYSGNVKFHCSEVEDFLRRAADGASSTSVIPMVYNHIILDLPGSHKQMALAAAVLKVDGCLLLWVPSITQILEATKAVRKEGLPLYLDHVVEVGQGVSGGRLWDVRPTRIRDFDRKARSLQQAHEAQQDSDSTADDSVEEPGSGPAVDTQVDEPATTTIQDEGEAIICRPKVGERTVGGGFIGLWRRTRDSP